MTLAHALGRALVDSGIRHGFGVVGSGNFHLSRAFADAGGTFTAARHEGGAATMADAYARTSGEVAMLSVHQGCGYTNAITGITEAAKSRTPLVVLAPAATAPDSNFYINQRAIARAIGAAERTLTDPATAVADLASAVDSARRDRQTVVVNLPVTLLAEPDPGQTPRAPTPAQRPAPTAADLERFRDVLLASRRPVFIAGRGARGARGDLLALAEQSGALLATSAVGAGLFSGEDSNLGISGGFSSPVAARLIADADLLVGWGCALNMWTTRHGRLIGEGAKVVQVDDTPAALGAHRAIDLGVHGDAARTAAMLRDLLEQEGAPPSTGYRTREVQQQLEASSWPDLPFQDSSGAGRIDPRTLTLELNSMLPQPRVVGIDSGNFMGYPAAFFDHVDERSLCFTQAFQSIGLGLATAIGAAIAAPDRLALAALGDGGAAMSLAELETISRLELPMIVVVYNDSAYSAEVHHFAGENHDQVRFPDVDFARVATGLGFEALTVGTRADLAPVPEWLRRQDRPLLIDAKITSREPAWWLREAFGH